jgi:hypothetical protein
VPDAELAVVAMVETARLKRRTEPETAVLSWLKAEHDRIAVGGHPEVHDTIGAGDDHLRAG